MHFLAKKFQKKERKIKFSNTEALGVCAQVEGAVLHHVAAEVTGVHRVLVHQAPVGLDLKLINRVNDLCDGLRFSKFAHYLSSLQLHSHCIFKCVAKLNKKQ